MPETPADKEMFSRDAKCVARCAGDTRSGVRVHEVYWWKRLLDSHIKSKALIEQSYRRPGHRLKGSR